MSTHVEVKRVETRTLAAVRRQVKIGEVGSAWRPALDRVWAFLRSQPGLHAGGHNVFLYHHPSDRSLPMDVDFGVEVTRTFVAEGDVHPIETPAGDVAMVVHIGSYDGLRLAHQAIHEWARANHRTFAGKSWEIYGDWTDDASKLETTVVYLLA